MSARTAAPGEPKPGIPPEFRSGQRCRSGKTDFKPPPVPGKTKNGSFSCRLRIDRVPRQVPAAVASGRMWMPFPNTEKILKNFRIFFTTPVPGIQRRDRTPFFDSRRTRRVTGGRRESIPFFRTARTHSGPGWGDAESFRQGRIGASRRGSGRRIDMKKPHLPGGGGVRAGGLPGVRFAGVLFRLSRLRCRRWIRLQKRLPRRVRCRVRQRPPRT